MTTRRTLLRIALALCAGSLAPAVHASDWPSRPIHVIVAFPPGGPSDTLVRIVAQHLSTTLGQPVVVDNRTGASGRIGADAAARAAPDGYTLFVAGANNTISPSLPDGGVDPTRAFVAVARLVTQPILITAHPSLPAKDLPSLVALARQRPGAVAYSTAGIGTPTHLAAVLLASRAGIEFLHVPYHGSGQPLRDVIAGEVPVSFAYLGAAEGFLASGALRPIAVTSAQRIAALPAVPAVAESGFPGFEVTSWYGIVAPAGTPQPIVERLSRELLRIVALPEVRERLRALGMEAAPLPADAFAAAMRDDVALWARAVRAAGQEIR